MCTELVRYISEYCALECSKITKIEVELYLFWNRNIAETIISPRYYSFFNLGSDSCMMEALEVRNFICGTM
jgi:hypothetical protein